MLSKRGGGCWAYNYFYCYNFSFLYLFAPARTRFFYVVYLCSFFVSRDRSWVHFLLSFVLSFVSSVLACVFSWAAWGWVRIDIVNSTILFFPLVIFFASLVR